MVRLRRLLVAALALTAFDGLASYLWLGSGLAHEGNPALARIMDVVGPAPALLGRVALGALLLFFLYEAAHHVELARAGLAIVAVALAGIGVWHLLGAAVMLTA